MFDTTRFGITEAYELARAHREFGEQIRAGQEALADAMHDLAAALRNEPRPETRAEKLARLQADPTYAILASLAGAMI